MKPVRLHLLHQLSSLTATVNIHTHLLGSILFFALPIAIYTRLTPRYEKATTADIVVFSTFFFGVAICFLLSATQETAAFANQLDYLGIVILIWGSTIPTVYYGFYCDEAVRDMYWMMISVLATACAITTLHPKFRHPTLRPYRALMYACLGLSASVFIAHGLIMHGWETQKARMSIDWMGLMAILNLVGAFIYALRVRSSFASSPAEDITLTISQIPEKWYPNQHDLFGSSHQIFHVMVVLAGLAHMFGLLRAFDHVHSSGFGCTSS
ncbi:hypothetical protein ACMFMG_009298 [Clarireedia jacksonii]